MSFLKKYSNRNQPRETMSLEAYMKKAKSDSSFYASPAERMLKAIGEPELVDTTADPRLARIFSNRTIKRYANFADFYGLEEVIERIVSFFRHSSQSLEEARQILYLLGPVGSAKSSLAERLKELMEREPIYVLTDAEGQLSPVNESPLGLFSADDSESLGIPRERLSIIASPWALKRLDSYDGDLSRFQVTKLFPSQSRQIAVSKTEPGDDNNQDISTLVGKLDIRKLEFYSQSDPDAYNYSGGLCLSNQGILDFVEMFKAPIKVLHPLLTATQERNYKGTEAIGPIPFDGVVLAHSNESEWEAFRANKNNEAFLDRVYIVEVPYCLRIDEEVKIYKKLLRNSKLGAAPCAPGTLEMLAEFCVASRIDVPENSYLESKIKVYNGENVKERDNTAKSYQEYKDLASRQEGFSGISTRTAYKIISELYNFDPQEIAADPVHLIFILDTMLQKKAFKEADDETLAVYLRKHLVKEFAKRIGKDIQTAYLESYDEYGQSLFDRYILWADYWVQDNDYRDPDTGQMLSREDLNEELTRLEKQAGISNPKDFRHEIVNFALRYSAANNGKRPDWRSYNKLRKVVEATMFSKTEDLLPVISFGGHRSKQESTEHEHFIDRMVQMGYTRKQVKRQVEWYMRNQKQ